MWRQSRFWNQCKWMGLTLLNKIHRDKSRQEQAHHRQDKKHHHQIHPANRLNLKEQSQVDKKNAQKKNNQVDTKSVRKEKNHEKLQNHDLDKTMLHLVDLITTILTTCRKDSRENLR